MGQSVACVESGNVWTWDTGSAAISSRLFVEGVDPPVNQGYAALQPSVDDDGSHAGLQPPNFGLDAAGEFRVSSCLPKWASGFLWWAFDAVSFAAATEICVRLCLQWQLLRTRHADIFRTHVQQSVRLPGLAPRLYVRPAC
jgi:hypothetical protein